MRITEDSLTGWLAARARMVTAALIAPFRRGQTSADIEVWIEAMPAGQRRAVIGATLGLLFLAALAAAQFGVVGMCLFFLGVILLVR
jgi:hypothetical protein